MSSFKLLTLILIIWWQFAVPTLGRRLHSPTLLQQLLYQVSHQGCVSRNFNGCCPHGSPSCRIILPDTKFCYCDQECFGVGDCCKDINEIQCYPPRMNPTEATTTAAPPTSTASPTTVTPEITTTITTIETTTVNPLTCAGQDFPIDPDGCCNTSKCYIILASGGLCFCDRRCHASKGEKCCDDVTQMGCYPRTCTEAGIPTCCMDGNLTNCKVEISRNNFCYCDQNCSQRHGGCCSDVACPQVTASPTTVTTEIPTTATTSVITTEKPATCAGQGLNNGPGPDGCCVSPPCFIETGLTACFCDRACYASSSETCCDDIEQIGCYPRNCTEAGKTCCTDTNSVNCRVRIAQNHSCYCDENCAERKDCCPDVETTNCPSNVASAKDQIYDLLAIAEEVMYQRMAAAFWRRYIEMKRKKLLS